MGAIGAEIDSQTVVTSANSDTPKMCHISGNIYAIVYEGADGDGFVDTYEIDASGNIGNAPIDSLEFDTTYCVYPEIVHVTGNYFAIIYVGGNPAYLRLTTVEIAADGTITDSVVDSETLWAGTPYEAPRIMAVVGTTDKFLYTYDLNLASGNVGTRTIGSDGLISAEIDTLAFVATRALRVHTIHVTGDIYVVVYQGLDDDGFAKTFSVDSSGNIGAAVLDTLEFDTATCAYPEITQVSGDYYVIAYLGAGSDGTLTTITIDNAGAIGDSVIDTFVFDATNGSDPSLVKVGTSLQFAVAYIGEGTDGYVKTVAISAVGVIDAVEDTWEFEIIDIARPFLMHTSSNIYVVAYRVVTPSGIVMKTATIGEVPVTVTGYNQVIIIGA